MDALPLPPPPPFPQPLKLAVVLLLVLLGWESEVGASSYISSTLEENVGLSSKVFAGYLTAISVDDEDGYPITTLYFSDIRWAFGGEGDSETVRYIGGTVGDTTIRTSGMPNFEEGWRYVVLIDHVGNPYVPFTAGEYGIYQVVQSRHDDELLVDAVGRVLLLTGTGKIRGAHWFNSDSPGEQIASEAPDFHRPLDESTFLEVAADWNVQAEAPIEVGPSGTVVGEQ